MQTTDVLVTVYAKGSERYILVYREDQRSEAFAAMGRWAGNPELSFAWQYDALRMGWELHKALQGG